MLSLMLIKVWTPNFILHQIQFKPFLQLDSWQNKIKMINKSVETKTEISFIVLTNKGEGIFDGNKVPLLGIAH